MRKKILISLLTLSLFTSLTACNLTGKDSKLTTSSTLVEIKAGDSNKTSSTESDVAADKPSETTTEKSSSDTLSEEPTEKAKTSDNEANNSTKETTKSSEASADSESNDDSKSSDDGESNDDSKSSNNGKSNEDNADNNDNENSKETNANKSDLSFNSSNEEAEIMQIVSDSLYFGTNVYNNPTISYEEEAADGGSLHFVSTNLYESYDAFESDIRNIFSNEFANTLLANDLYKEYEGKLAIDVDKIKARGYFVNWFDLSVLITEKTDTTYVLKVHGTLQEPGEEINNEDYYCNVTLVKENGKWLSTNLIY